MTTPQTGPGSARACTATVTGIEGHLAWAQAALEPGAPGLLLAGLPATTTAETRDRVRAALINSGQQLPDQALTVDMQPPGLVQRGAAHDLAIAVAVLAAAGVVPAGTLARCLFYAELGLDGTLRPARGVIPALTAAARAGHSTAVVAAVNAAEAAIAPGMEVIGCADLRQVIARLRSGVRPASPTGPALVATRPAASPVPVGLAALGISPVVRLGLEASAAGGHHLRLAGWPDQPVAALATGLAALLPPLAPGELAEVAAIYSAAGLLGAAQPLITDPPFRAPRHTTSARGMAGGGAELRPGEAVLAHRGVLFLDQAPEFARDALAVLRQPLQYGEITVRRGGRMIRFPARFLLAAGLSPCPCGQRSGCNCMLVQKTRYRSRLTLELGHHLAITLDAAPTRGRGTDIPGQDPDAQSVVRVAAARARTRRRLVGTPWTLSSDIPAADLRRYHQPTPGALAPITRAADLGEISMRAADQILRVAWTLADLADLDRPGADECAQALAFYLGAAR